MLKFKEFIKENHEMVIGVDAKYLAGNRDAINSDLEVLTSKPYQNAAIFLNQLRGTIERYGILLPQSITKNFMDLSGEMVYALGDTGEYFYVVYDTNDDSFVDGYAQVVSKDELDDLMSADLEDNINSDREPVRLKKSGYIANGYGPGKEDDGGNTNEY